VVSLNVDYKKRGVGGLMGVLLFFVSCYMSVTVELSFERVSIENHPSQQLPWYAYQLLVCIQSEHCLYSSYLRKDPTLGYFRRAESKVSTISSYELSNQY